MADAKVERWGQFEERERGLLALGLGALVLFEGAKLDRYEDPADIPEEARVEMTKLFLSVAEMMNQLSEHWGLEGIEPELLQRMADRLNPEA